MRQRLGGSSSSTSCRGGLAALQGFRGTICSYAATDLLESVLSGTRSPLAEALAAATQNLEGALAKAITRLHWKDFETLTDLVFRAAGWIRVSVLGETAKSFDLELREPITGDRYVVQVKSRADQHDLESTLEGFSPTDFKRLFFVVHSPTRSLLDATQLPPYVELVLPQRLGQLVIEGGLVAWVQSRVA